MSTATKKRTTEEVVEEVKAAAGPESTEEEKKRKQEEQDEAFFAKLPNPCVYCGPSVRNVARQFTVYHGGTPDALKEFIKEHRAARGLLVSVERSSQVRKRLETPGTGEFILFQKVRAEI